MRPDILGDLLLWPFNAAFTSATIVLGILILAFWIWMIIDCAKRKFKSDAEKIIWIALVVIFHWIGALIYLLVIKTSNPRGLSKK